VRTGVVSQVSKTRPFDFAQGRLWGTQILGATTPRFSAALVERAIGPELLVSDGADRIETICEQVFDFELIGVLGEEPFALAGSPGSFQVVVA
jgi:hypothetical protein